MEIRTLIKHCWQQKCYNETDYMLSRLDCYWYTLKAIACILLSREAKLEFDFVTVAVFNVHTWHSYHEGPSGGFDFIAVGTNSWQYAIMNDGWP